MRRPIFGIGLLFKGADPGPFWVFGAEVTDILFFFRNRSWPPPELSPSGMAEFSVVETSFFLSSIFAEAGNWLT